MRKSQMEEANKCKYKWSKHLEFWGEFYDFWGHWIWNGGNFLDLVEFLRIFQLEFSLGFSGISFYFRFGFSFENFLQPRDSKFSTAHLTSNTFHCSLYCNYQQPTPLLENI
jgi:hypothetical protein